MNEDKTNRLDDANAPNNAATKVPNSATTHPDGVNPTDSAIKTPAENETATPNLNKPNTAIESPKTDANDTENIADKNVDDTPMPPVEPIPGSTG